MASKKTVWKKGWLCRDDTLGGGVGFIPLKPILTATGTWWIKEKWWTPSEFRRNFDLNFPFPQKGSIHHVEMEFDA